MKIAPESWFLKKNPFLKFNLNEIDIKIIGLN